MKRKKHYLYCITITILIILIGYLFLFLIGPIMLAGSPCPLYYITNNSNENHTIIVEILDENNYTVQTDTYNLSPLEKVKYDRGIGWYPKASWYLITWPDGIYTFYFTLDNEYSKSYTTDVFPTCSLDVELFHKDYWKNETIPIDIGEICV